MKSNRLITGLCAALIWGFIATLFILQYFANQPPPTKAEIIAEVLKICKNPDMYGPSRLAGHVPELIVEEFNDREYGKIHYHSRLLSELESWLENEPEILKRKVGLTDVVVLLGKPMAVEVFGDELWMAYHFSIGDMHFGGSADLVFVLDLQKRQVLNVTLMNEEWTNQTW